MWTRLVKFLSVSRYIAGNVVPCCSQCNVAKSDYTVTEFKDWIERAYKYCYAKV